MIICHHCIFLDHFKTELLFLYWFWVFLYTRDTSSFLYICFCRDFLLSICLIFSFSYLSFEVHVLYILIRYCLSACSLLIVFLMSCYETFAKDFLLPFVVKFLVFPFVVRFMAHFESSFLFIIHDINFFLIPKYSSVICWKDNPFCPELLLHLCWLSVIHVMAAYFGILYFDPLIYLSIF